MKRNTIHTRFCVGINFKQNGLKVLYSKHNGRNLAARQFFYNQDNCVEFYEHQHPPLRFSRLRDIETY